MLLQRRTVEEGGHVLGDAGDVCFGADETSPSGAVGAISGRKDILVGEERRRDLCDDGIMSYPFSEWRTKKDGLIPEDIH